MDPGLGEQRRVFRLWPGLAQMAGATITGVLLWSTGPSRATTAGLVVTTALTI